MGKKKWIFLVIGFLFSGTALYILINNIDLKIAFEYIKSIQLKYIIFSLITLIVGFLLRAWRWNLIYFDKVNFQNSLYSIIIGYAGNNILPFRGGEIMRILYFSKVEQKNKINVTTSLVSEKLLDLVSILILLYLLLTFFPTDSEVFQNLKIYASLLVLSPILVLILIRIFSKQIKKLNFNESSKINVLFDEIVKGLEAIEFIKINKNFLLIFLSSIGIWGVEVFLFYWIIIAFGLVYTPLLTAVAAMVFVAFGIFIPSAPAYIGIFQGMVVLAMAQFGYTNEESLAVGVSVHFLQFLPITLTGVLLYFFKIKKQLIRIS
jgi:uncharacterized protein (TIRG00374 family)